MKNVSTQVQRIRMAFLLFWIVIILTACATAPDNQTATPRALNTAQSATPLPPTLTTTASSTPQTPTQTPSPSPSPTPAPAVLIGAGDIALCGDDPQYQGDEKTAQQIEKLIAESPQTAVFTAGDNSNADGKLAELKNCFGKTWGRFLERIHPAPGNHDYQTNAAEPYFTYFGDAAGQAGFGFYSYDLGDWHIIALNSNCNDIACGPESKQVKWLRDDIQASGKKCMLAYWHHPRWSSGLAGGRSAATFWKTVTELGVDVVVNGHDHDYERFAPQDADGSPTQNGTREFVVGTGGAMLRDWGTIKPNSEVRYNQTHGVIQFKLFPGRYEWQFYPVDDEAMTDMGSDICHD